MVPRNKSVYYPSSAARHCYHHLGVVLELGFTLHIVSVDSNASMVCSTAVVWCMYYDTTRLINEYIREIPGMYY